MFQSFSPPLETWGVQHEVIPYWSVATVRAVGLLANLIALAISCAIFSKARDWAVVCSNLKQYGPPVYLKDFYVSHLPDFRQLAPPHLYALLKSHAKVEPRWLTTHQLQAAVRPPTLQIETDQAVSTDATVNFVADCEVPALAQIFVDVEWDTMAAFLGAAHKVGKPLGTQQTRSWWQKLGERLQLWIKQQRAGSGGRSPLLAEPVERASDELESVSARRHGDESPVAALARSILGRGGNRAVLRLEPGIDSRCKVQLHGLERRQHCVATVVVLTAEDTNHRGQILLVRNGPGEQHLELLVANSTPAVWWPMPVFGMDENERDGCLICLSSPKRCVLFPCRHLATCAECLTGLLRDVCPICRAPFHSWLELVDMSGAATEQTPPGRAASVAPLTGRN